MLRDERCFLDFGMEEDLQTVFLKLAQLWLQGLQELKTKPSQVTDLKGLFAAGGGCAGRDTGFNTSATALPLRPSSPNIGAAAVADLGPIWPRSGSRSEECLG